MDAPRNGMETLPSDQGTHKRDVVSPVSTGLPSLFTVSPMFGSRPAANSSTAGSGFTPFLKANKHRQLYLLCQPGGHQGRQAGFILPWMLHAASRRLAWVLQAAPTVSPRLSPGTNSSLHPAGGRSQLVSPHGRGSQGCHAPRTRMKSPFVWYEQDRSQCHAWVWLAGLPGDPRAQRCIRRVHEGCAERVRAELQGQGQGEVEGSGLGESTGQS